MDTTLPIESHFYCPLCNRLPCDAVQTPCTHYFCKSCIQQFWECYQKKICPSCGKTTKNAKAIPNYENNLRSAFPEAYEEQNDSTNKMDHVEAIKNLFKSINTLCYARNSLFSRVRNSNIREQARDFFHTDRLYSIIHCDCPWDYPNLFFNGSIKGKYQSMKDEELYALPVEGLCRENAVLLFWTTFPKLDIAINCIYAWGFTYTTCFFAWCKIRPMFNEVFEPSDVFTGGGAYTRNNVEVCLLGLKGQISKQRCRNTYISNAIVVPPEPNPLMTDGELSGMTKSRLFADHQTIEDSYFNLESACFFGVRGEHSEKPRETYEKIVTFWGDLPRIDLFGREEKPGWDIFGNQKNKFPAKVAMSKEFDLQWKHRQDLNADFAEDMVKRVTALWNNRDLMEVEMKPRSYN